MSGDYEEEIRIALEEGVLTSQEADTLREEARRLGRSPLELLRERWLSEETLALVQRRASDPERRHARLEEAAPREQVEDRQARSPVQVSPLDETATIAPAGASLSPITPPLGEGAKGPAFPVPGWDRYQHVGFLGQGGMGRVFLAYDPRLRRQVALKFVREDHPELVHRFLSEARAQARVNHERVCKVYEVGEVDQKAFIAMQYVEGRSLGALVHELTVEQKALVLREVALGVHEAHRAGLIHRDIKPSNIMVERAGDGVPRPYVMDFGLARDWKEGVTVTGTVLGTPHYMAPEQARGEVTRLDRRADVYSLGATLYALLTGQPPIQGGNGLEVLNNLATVEPRPPRELDRNIPPDLEAITLKCLEKEPSARYDSARALAEELDRFLAGEPVLARTGHGYRLRKRLRKHRLLLSAATAALLAVAVAVGWGVLARREASERERLTRHFTELADRIESRVRYSALSRLHDAREDRQAIQAIHTQMETLEAEMRQGGEQALGPGHYALGRGALARGDAEKAREHLEAAWQHGFREPPVAYALARALGQSYQQQLLEAERLHDPEKRDPLLRDLERRYRDPALAYLKQGQGAADSAEYVAALIAFYEGRLDDALTQLDAVSSKLPWLYEAPKLRGDILVARFYKRRREEDLDGAKADLEAGRKAYAAATAIAESAPVVYQGLVQLEVAEMTLQSDSQGDVMPAYTRSHDALMKWHAISPDDYMCWVTLAHLHFSLASSESMNEVEGVFAKAIEAAERALALAPARHEARMVLAEIFRSRARSPWSGVSDTRQLLRKAIDLMEGVRLEDRNLEFHRMFAQLLCQWALDGRNSGEDALGHLDRAIQETQVALALDERDVGHWMNLGSMYRTRARNRNNSEPERDLAQALLAYDKVRSLIPHKWVAYSGSGKAYEDRARWLRNRGGNPMPDLMRALEQYRQGLTLDTQNALFHRLMGGVLLQQGRETWVLGENPFPLLDEARASIEQAIRVSPGDGYSHVSLGTLLAQRARYLRARGEDPSQSVREAEEIVKRGLDGGGDDPNLSFILGSAYIIRAGFNVDRGRDPGAELARAEEELRRALAHQPNEKAEQPVIVIGIGSKRAAGPGRARAEAQNRHALAYKPGNAVLQSKAEAWLQLGEAQALRAKWQAHIGMGRAEDFEEATRSYEKAIELEPDELEYLLRLGQHCAAWATWQKQAGVEHAVVLERGLGLADRILKARPDWIEAQALRASLLQASQ